VHDTRGRAPRRRGHHRRNRLRHDSVSNRGTPRVLGRVCPGNNESAGRRRSGRSRKGSKWLRGTLIEAARAAARTRDTYLAAQHRRVRGRRGANRASLAIAHSLLVAVWHMLRTGETYHDAGGDFYARRDPERTSRRLVAQLERLGHTVTIHEGAA
jgi:transposase